MSYFSIITKNIEKNNNEYLKVFKNEEIKRQNITKDKLKIVHNKQVNNIDSK